MSNSGGSSGLGSSTGAKEHKARPKSGQIGQGEMEYGEKIEWMMNTAGVSEEEAKEILDKFEKYTDGGKSEYKAIHNGQDKEAEAAIDKLLNNRNVPVYDGETFRGLYIRNEPGRSAESIVHDLLSSGRWYEPGITSFTSNRGVAVDFSDPLMGGGTGARVIIRNVSNKTGVPVAHLSGHSNENEVMYSSSIKNRGFKILNWTQRGNSFHVDVQE